MKKFFIVLLTMTIIVLNCVIVFANIDGSMENFKTIREYEKDQFVDVVSSDWFAENVKMAYELSLVNGTSNTTFSPNSNITIAETITLASRLNNIYYFSKYSFDYDEVWYKPYVDYAIQKGIIQKNEYTKFDEYASREQFAQIFALALPSESLLVINNITDNTIPDVSMQSEFSDSIYKLYRAGILTGSDDKGSFMPDTYIKRSEVATIVSRMANENLRKRFTISESHKTQSVKSSEDIYNSCSSAIFYIELYNSAGNIMSTGSGFFIDSSGIAITNYHVIEDAFSAKITLPETQTEYNVAGVYNYNQEQDWAIIQVEGTGFEFLDIGNDANVKVGQKVYAIGSPLGLQNTISEGLLSNKRTIINDVEYYQISAPISHGSSGGALLNESGEVIGITSASFVDGQNLNLSVPMYYINLNFDRNNCKSLEVVSIENNTISPPNNIRVVKQENNVAYIQWDEVVGAEYYYFYYQEDGEESFWYDCDEQTGEQVRLMHNTDYSATLVGLESGKRYNVIVTAIKGQKESKDSKILSFEYIMSNDLDVLRNAIVSNTIPIDGYLYKLLIGKGYDSGIEHYTALVYDSKRDEIYIETVGDFESGNKVVTLLFLDGAPERVNTQKRVMYQFYDYYGNTITGMTDIDPSTFRESTNVFFNYYNSPYDDLVKNEDQNLCATFLKIGLRGSNSIFGAYNIPLDMVDFGFLYYK